MSPVLLYRRSRIKSTRSMYYLYNSMAWILCREGRVEVSTLNGKETCALSRVGQESEEIFPKTRLKTESHEKMEINRTRELTLKIERNIAVSFLFRPSSSVVRGVAFFNFLMCSKMFPPFPSDFLWLSVLPFLIGEHALLSFY
jgi:hypothetical protein